MRLVVIGASLAFVGRIVADPQAHMGKAFMPTFPVRNPAIDMSIPDVPFMPTFPVRSPATSIEISVPDVPGEVFRLEEENDRMRAEIGHFRSQLAIMELPQPRATACDAQHCTSPFSGFGCLGYGIGATFILSIIYKIFVKATRDNSPGDKHESYEWYRLAVASCDRTSMFPSSCGLRTAGVVMNEEMEFERWQAEAKKQMGLGGSDPEPIEASNKRGIELRALPNGESLRIRQHYFNVLVRQPRSTIRGGDRTGLREWPCTMPMLNAVAPRIAGPLRVLELGSGCGALGMGIAAIDPEARVLLTDPGLPVAFEDEDEEPGSTLGWLATNIGLNRDLIGDRADAAQLLWGCAEHIDAIKQTHPAFDLIVGCDLLYHTDSYEALLTTMRAFSAVPPHPPVILAYTKRHGREQEFVAAASEHYVAVTQPLRVSEFSSSPSELIVFTPKLTDSS